MGYAIGVLGQPPELRGPARSVTGAGPYVTANRSVNGRESTESVTARTRRICPHRRSASRPDSTRRSTSWCTAFTDAPTRPASSVNEYSSPGFKYVRASRSPWTRERRIGSRAGAVFA